MRINFSYILNRPTDVETSVLIKYSFDSQRVKGKKSTGLIVESKHWEKTKGKREYQSLKTRDSKSISINQNLKKWKNDIEELFHEFIRENQRYPTKHEFGDILDKAIRGNESVKKVCMNTFVQQFIEDSKNRFNPSTQKKIVPGTIGSYKRTGELLSEFLKKYSIEPSFESFDVDCYKKFVEFLYTEKSLGANTVGKHIRNLKRFASEAREYGIEVHRAFSGKSFVAPYVEKDKVYLSNEEIEKLYRLDLTENPRLERVRDLFVFECKTGLRFSDLGSVNEESVSISDRGMLLNVRMKKTARRIVTPLYDMSKDILLKYDYRLPTISNQKYNTYLKELCELVPQLTIEVNIDNKRVRKSQLVSSHTARRSFASNAYIDSVPVYTFMAITGHKSESSFLRYLRLSPQDHAKSFLDHMAESTKLIEFKPKAG